MRHLPERWEKIGNEMLSLFHQLAEGCAAHPEHFPFLRLPGKELQVAEALRLELAGRSRVDHAAHSLAVEAPPPSSPLPSMDGYFLMCRLGLAIEFLGDVYNEDAARVPFGPPPQDWTYAALWTFLLVDYWHRRGDRYLQSYVGLGPDGGFAPPSLN
jgi:hypothetical protein